METDRSYVKVLLKQGVSKDSGVGYEIECKMCKGDSSEEVLELGKQALKIATEIKKSPLGQ